MKRLTNLEHCKYLLNTQVLALRVLLQSNDVSANFVLHLSKSLKLPIREPLKANYRDFRIGFVWGFYGSDPQFNTSTITPAHASPQCDCCCQIVVTWSQKILRGVAGIKSIWQNKLSISYYQLSTGLTIQIGLTSSWPLLAWQPVGAFQLDNHFAPSR